MSTVEDPGNEQDQLVGSRPELIVTDSSSASEAAQAITPVRPSVPPAADLACANVQFGWLALCFGVTFLIYAALIPRFLLYSSPPTGDQPFYLMDTISLVQDGDINVKNNYDHHDEEKFYSLAPHPPGFVGMTAPRPLVPQLAPNIIRPASEQYSVHLPGLPVLLVPAWVIGSWFALWWPATIVMMCLLGALLAVNIFLLAYEMTGRLWAAVGVWLPLAFSSPLMTYSYLIFTELPIGLLLIYAFRRLGKGWAANGPWRWLLVGLCIGYIPWLAWHCLPLTLLLCVYAAVQWYRYRRDVLQGEPSRAWLVLLRRDALPLAAPLLVSAALLIAYHLFLYGRPFAFDIVGSEVGQHAPFHWPWGGANDLNRFLNGTFGVLFDIQWGVLTYTPVYLLAAVGMIAMAQSDQQADRRLLIALLGIALPYAATITAFEFWTGIWSPPARYMTSLVPLLAGPLALSLVVCRRRLYIPMYALLALVGVALMAIMMYDPIRLWPFGDGRLFYGGVFDWLAQAPAAPFHIDLRHVLPSFNTPDEVRQPGNTARVLTIAAGIVFVGSLLIHHPPAVWPQRRLVPRAIFGLTWAGAVALLGLGWYIVNAPYLKPQIVLIEQHRWNLPHPLVEAHGLAYLDGKLYISSLGPRSATGTLQAGVGELGEFDPATGSYTPIHLIGASGPLPYSYPGDVKVGQDHLLYLLNNGPDNQALYVLRPDGHVVRQIVLNGKGSIAIGFDIGPDGKLYATDMSRIHQYGPSGGRPLASWGKGQGSFNNIAGIAVDSENRIYGAETSEKSLNILDSSGQLLRSLDLRCHPWQVAVAGDWVDIACEGGVRSFNRKTGDLQASRIGEHDAPVGTLTGLAYGPANTIYVLDRNTIIAYQMQR